jgi:hypothetical protein
MPDNRDVLTAIEALKTTLLKAIQTMSMTLSAQLTAEETQAQADFQTLQGNVMTIVAAFSGVNPGDQLTAAQVAAISTLDASMNSLNSSVTAAVAAAAPPPVVVTPPAPPAPPVVTPPAPPVDSTC